MPAFLVNGVWFALPANQDYALEGSTRASGRAREGAGESGREGWAATSVDEGARASERERARECESKREQERDEVGRQPA